jgi:carbonic anhydrase
MNPEPTASGKLPQTATEAHDCLNRGNQQFSEWVASECKQSDFESQTGLVAPDSVSQQSPFGIVVGCSDARFPLRAALGQRTNSLFEVRVAGNVLADECLGSIDYALHHLPSVKALVVLGHTHCGAVTAAVGAFQKPATINAHGLSVGLRAIVQRLLGPVIQSSAALGSVAAELAAGKATNQQLIETAIYVHAATAAHDLLAQVKQAGRTDVAVLHGVFDLQDYLIRAPRVTAEKNNALQAGLSPAPQATEELEQLALATASSIVGRA